MKSSTAIGYGFHARVRVSQVTVRINVASWRVRLSQRWVAMVPAVSYFCPKVPNRFPAGMVKVPL